MDNIAPITPNKNPLPWVNDVKHLGNTLQSNNSMKLDCSGKRGKFIGKINSLLQEFHYTSPQVTMNIINMYATSFYGSQLWDLQSPECDRLYKAWNVMVRNVYKLDRCTHKYFIESVSNCLHPRVMLASRFVKFHKSCIESSKLSVRLLSRLSESDNRTVMGSTLSLLLTECNIERSSPDKLTTAIVKFTCKYSAAPTQEIWRLDILNELLDSNMTIPEFTSDEISAIVKSICIE